MTTRKLTITELDGLAEDALNAAVAHIRNTLGIKSGDLAAHVFSDRRVQNELRAYIAMEIGTRGLEVTDEAPPIADPAPIYRADLEERCAYDDCVNGYPVTTKPESVSCPLCRAALCLPTGPSS
jgi:hypothetical protein